MVASEGRGQDFPNLLIDFGPLSEALQFSLDRISIIGFHVNVHFDVFLCQYLPIMGTSRVPNAAPNNPSRRLYSPLNAGRNHLSLSNGIERPRIRNIRRLLPTHREQDLPHSSRWRGSVSIVCNPERTDTKGESAYIWRLRVLCEGGAEWARVEKVFKSKHL